MNKEIYQSYNILKKVYFQSAYASIELNKLIKISKFDMNTKLVTKIVYGVLEKDITLNYIVEHFINKEPEPSIKLILKIGAYISRNVDGIPPFACVNELVEITKKYESKFSAGFVNATLKSIISNKVSLPSKDNIVKYLSVKFGYPEWIIELLIKQHDLNFTISLLETSLTTLTHIRVLNKKISVEDFLEKLDVDQIKYENTNLSNTFNVDYEKLISKRELSDYYVAQGLPSIITCEAFGNDLRGNLLDLCSAPGGKSINLAYNNPNLNVLACDKGKRVELIQSFKDSQKLTNVEVMENDALIKKESWLNKFDYVLADVPCSNLGIVNKKPDVLLNKSLEDIKSLMVIQSQILNNASDYVRIGGVLVYSTCTINKTENIDIINEFLQNHINFKLEKINTFGIDVVNESETCAFYPNISKTEGFFIARMVKNE